MDRWQDYAEHYGGVVYFKSPTAVALTDVVITPGEGYKDDWSFTIDRQRRKGTLVRKGRPKVAFSCAGAI